MIGAHEKLAAIFQAEHAEHLGEIRSILALLENVPEARGRSELDEAFRHAHSLKGAARAVDLPPVEGLAQGLETLFSRVREGGIPLDKKTAGVVLQVLESSEDCLAAFRENRTPDKPAAALRAMEELLSGQAGFVPEPPVFAAVPEASAPAAAFRTMEMVRVAGEDLDHLVRSTGQIVTQSFQQRTVTQELVALGLHVAEVQRVCGRFRDASSKSLRRLSGDPELAPAVRHIEFIEREVHSLARQSRKARLMQQHGAWNIHSSAERLQQDVWSARMAPAEDLFEGFRKMVRDLARDEKKEIVFRLNGSGVKADRLVLQALKDPLMHLLRNAISHGIELPHERQSKGKPGVGALTVSLESQGGRLVIQVDDDGRGVDFEKVAQVAVARGVLPLAAGVASPQDLARILFRPGFSTSPSVTDLSGRGMGLSVVYESVRRLQGEVELRPREGPGASILLSVPLSVSTLHLLLVLSAGQTFGIPTHGIDRLYRVRTQQIETVESKAVVNLDGRRVPLFSLEHLLEINARDPAFSGDILSVVVLRSGGRRAAVVVDEFLSERDALIQDLGIPCPTAGNVSGGVLLRDGVVSVVLNPAGLVETTTRSARPVLPAKQASEKVAASILVVDDSITTRSLETSILEAHGYRVWGAVDGIEALQLLRAEKADLVIADIEMPRLDGFGLLAAMKADKRLDRIPVIIVSSLDRPEDKQRGLDLGADAYVVKGKFDQQELLGAIQQFL